MNSTISAIATPPGRGAIAIIRVSGPKSLMAYKKLTKLKMPPQPNQIRPAWIYDGSDKLDQSMLAYFQAPNSFTGEDMLEIHCHGSKIVQDAIMSLLNSAGIEPAKPGEFSERAYYNGKIDVAQAEAIMELVASENTQLAKLATRQLAGEFSNKITEIRIGLTRLSSAIAADLDFSEEDTPSVDKKTINMGIKEALEKLNILQANSEILPKLREGIHVALVGLPNAGKSTLLNYLLGFERSIVTEIAGTTRDTISEAVEIDGITYHFTDTAGLNTNPDKVEKIGIQKTIDFIKSADMIILLIEPGKADKTADFIKKQGLEKFIDSNNTITVYTKSDINKTKAELSISAKNGQGISKLIEAIKKRSDAHSTGNLQILTTRQLNLLESITQSLINIQDNLDKLTHDIIGAELQSAINDLNELTGEQATKQIIDSIFRNFCIGKWLVSDWKIQRRLIESVNGISRNNIAIHI